jgi:Phage tail lysozyme
MAESGKVTAKDIYLQLLHDGASQVEAIGIMANMMNESSLDPEAVNPAGPQSGVGLVQWQTTDYPAAAHLVTGHPLQDMQAQVRFLALTGGFKAAQGSNAGQSAGNFAANYEKCATCQPGGSQFQARVQNTLAIAGWAKSGKWPAESGKAAAQTGGLSVSGPGNTPDCLWAINLNVPLIGGNICLFTKSEVRALAGGLLMASGGSLALAALVLLAAGAGMKAGGPVGKVAEGVGGTMMLVPGAEPAGAAISAAGRTARNPARAGRERAARLDAADRKRLGEPKENPDLEVRGGTVRESGSDTAARRRRQSASRARSRRAVSTGQRPASREETGF